MVSNSGEMDGRQVSRAGHIRHDNSDHKVNWLGLMAVAETKKVTPRDSGN